MAIVHDVIPPFQLFQPASVDDALELLEARARGLSSPAAWTRSTGSRTAPSGRARSSSSSQIELQGIRDANGGFEIGAMTTLTEIAEHAGIRERFGILAEAAGLVASPQIRNQGTLGGNISQDTAAGHYRRGWHCYRAGGNICYADTPTAINREHAILAADRAWR